MSYQDDVTIIIRQFGETNVYPHKIGKNSICYILRVVIIMTLDICLWTYMYNVLMCTSKTTFFKAYMYTTFLENNHLLKN